MFKIDFRCTYTQVAAQPATVVCSILRRVCHLMGAWLYVSVPSSRCLLIMGKVYYTKEAFACTPFL